MDERAAPDRAGRMRRLLLRSPGVVPAVLLLPVFVLFASDKGGYPSTTWYPAAMFLIAALAVLALALPASARVPGPTAVATTLLFAYAGWSYLSITWAAQKGVAWEGANRTALYAVVFALVALWPMRARPAVVVAGALGLAVALVGVGELIASAASDEPLRWFLAGRFALPTGYTNANVALWMVGFFPCLALGASRQVPPWARALLLGACVVLVELALLGQSRAWQFATPIAVILFLAAARERMRVVLSLLAVVAAAAAAAPSALGVYDDVTGGLPVGPALDSARDATLLAAAVLALLAYVAARTDSRTRVGRATAQRVGRTLTLAALVGVVVGMGVVLARADVSGSVSHAWDTFVKGTEPTSSARFGSTLGSQRYDFWRVSWHQFERAPVGGAGSDNFQQDYLRERRSIEEPRYPHSVAFRTLAQTGIVGVLLFGGALAAALAGALRAVRRRPPGLGASAALAGLGAFVYWFVHACGDWLFEYPGVAAPAFAMLGLACALQPRSFGRGGGAGPRPRVRGAMAVAVAVAAVVALASMGAPWFSERYVQYSASTWQKSSADAFRRLDQAATLDPLSADPHLVAGTIALELGRTDDARRHFRDALERDPRETYALLQLGVLTADAGDREAGVALVERARALDPRNDASRVALRRLRQGRKVDLARINADVLSRSRQRLSPRQ